MDDMSDVARVLFAIACGGGVATLAHFIADRRERRKWRSAVRRIPFITE